MLRGSRCARSGWPAGRRAPRASRRRRRRRSPRRARRSCARALTASPTLRAVRGLVVDALADVAERRGGDVRRSRRSLRSAAVRSRRERSATARAAPDRARSRTRRAPARRQAAPRRAARRRRRVDGDRSDATPSVEAAPRARAAPPGLQVRTCATSSLRWLSSCRQASCCPSCPACPSWPSSSASS